MMKYYFILAGLFFLVSCSVKKADLLVYNAHIFTVNDQFDTASVLVVKDGKFIAVGNDSLLKEYDAAEKVDAKGQYLYPGFIDAHCHFTGYAMDKYKLALFGTKSFNEVLTKVQDYARTNTREWIEGRGWDQNDWDKKEFPDKDSLDRLFPSTPVFLMRIDGHAILCNQAALDKAGITKDTKIAGGEVLLKNGEPSGILIDNAVDVVKAVLPQRTQEEIVADLVQAQQDCIALGLTGVVDCGIKHGTVNHLKAAYAAKKLFLKVTAYLSDEEENYTNYLSQKPYNDGLFHIAGYKIYADGALGSRGAYLIRNYADRHDHRGFLLKSSDSIRMIAEKLIATNYQMCAHAIGDAANREVLHIYASVLKGRNNRRWRIEHAQVVDSADMHLFGEYNIIPSVQPTHATSDMYWAGDRLGQERLKEAYAYKQLLQQNNWLPLGTDFPVESLNPLLTFFAAVFRIDKMNFPAGGFQSENALSRMEALKGITTWAARSVFEESYKGSIEVGRQADFVLLPVNLLQEEAARIYDANVQATYIDGKLRYSVNEEVNALH